MPTAIWRLQLRSGIHAHCDLALAVEVWYSRRRGEERRGEERRGGGGGEEEEEEEKSSGYNLRTLTWQVEKYIV